MRVAPVSIAIFLVLRINAAQPAPAEFAVPTQLVLPFVSEGGPLPLATGDFNNDGYKDIALLQPGGVSIILGGVNGPTLGSTYPLSSYPMSISVADFNRDGRLDLVVATQISGASIFLFFGNGDGTFTGPVPVTVPEVAFFAVAGDFNGDGNPDIASTDGDRNIYISLGNGDGTFQPAASFRTGKNNFPVSLAAASFHNNGRDDLLVTSELQSLPCNALNPCFPIYLYASNGDGTFSFQQVVANNTYEPLSIAIADLNHDGFPDIVADRIAVYNSVAVLLNDGTGNFGKPATYPADAAPWAITVGDVNSDGVPDIVTANDAGSISVLYGVGDGTFQAAFTYNANLEPVAVDAGNYFKNDTNDIVILNNTANSTLGATALSMIRSVAPGKPVAPRVLTAKRLSAAAVGDMNGDTYPDLLVGDANAVSLFLNRGDGNLDPPSNVLSIANATGIVIADFNGDGLQDFAACNDTTLQAALQTKSGSFSPAPSQSASCQPIYAGDLNHDGRPDLILLINQQTITHYASISVALGNGDGTFGVPSTIIPEPYTFALGDFNHDGAEDIAYCNQSPTHCAILLSKGDGTFQAPLSININGVPYLMAAGDLNGDGIPDLVISTQPPNGLAILFGNGNGTFVPASFLAGVDLPTPIQIGDFNHDGHADLLLSTNQFLLGDGAGNFYAQPGLLPCVGYTTCTNFPVDLNQDGKLDLLTVNINGSSEISALINTSK